MDFLFFLIIKILAYSVYLYVGLIFLRGDKAGYITIALLLGVLRVVVGLILGLVSIVFIDLLLPNGLSVPWLPIFTSSTILWVLFGRRIGRSFNSRTLMWILGGVVISTAFDAYGISRMSDWGRWGC
jgi:hypothetical protein